MINRVILVGRLTKDIELKKTTSGLSVATFTVACNRRVSQDQEKQADFINCVAWRQTADFLSQYAHKGDLVGVDGRMQTRSYDGTDGKKVYVTEVVCDSVQLLESRKKETQPTSNYSDESFEDFNAGPSLNISSDDLPF